MGSVPQRRTAAAHGSDGRRQAAEGQGGSQSRSGGLWHPRDTEDHCGAAAPGHGDHCGPRGQPDAQRHQHDALGDNPSPNGRQLDGAAAQGGDYAYYLDYTTTFEVASPKDLWTRIILGLLYYAAAVMAARIVAELVLCIFVLKDHFVGKVVFHRDRAAEPEPVLAAAEPPAKFHHTDTSGGEEEEEEEFVGNSNAAGGSARKRKDKVGYQAV